jgi:putative membrane protein
VDPDAILAIERPHPRLMRLYLVRALLSGPGLLVALPLLYFRYHTMRYRFDEEGISMSWGILFRREVKLTYARIQDIHLVSGIVQRALGLADLHVQTASGSSAAEMTLEGLLEFEAVRDFLYSRMRGARESAKHGPTPGSDETLALLREIVRELRGAREALERRGPA